MALYKFKSFTVRRFRSLSEVTIEIPEHKPVVVCGENNIGKTNLLRALNIFFNFNQKGIFSPKDDIPHNIYYGSRGQRSNCEFEGVFSKDGKDTVVRLRFDVSKEFEIFVDEKEVGEKDALKYIGGYRYLFIESNNINLPDLIASVLEKDGLLALDRKRTKQTRPLEKLEEFIELSQVAINDIEQKINDCFKELTDFDGILKDKEIKIKFVEFEKLRDAVKDMTSITLFDGNNHGIASKGSGAQRAVFLALMQYISANSDKKIIWGLDEPEAFLQPKLQKRVAQVISQVTKERQQPVILTTHSQHFVDLTDLQSTYLFEGRSEEKRYKRRPETLFYEITAGPIKVNSDVEKATLIKQHLGISNNDGWEVMPYNIVVEGEEDKKYLEAMFRVMDLPTPNVIWSGGASKIAGYLQFFNTFADELKYKPKIRCLFDYDEEGKTQARKIKPKKLSNLDLSVDFIPRCDGQEYSLSELELSSAAWAVEDFVQHNLVVDAVNVILKKEGYKSLTRKIKDDRFKPANQDEEILSYLERGSRTLNPEKQPFSLCNEGRKKQVCQIACGLMVDKPEKYPLTDSQKEFIEKIASEEGI